MIKKKSARLMLTVALAAGLAGCSSHSPTIGLSFQPEEISEYNSDAGKPDDTLHDSDSPILIDVVSRMFSEEFGWY